jgi:hypothetical protein
MEITRHADTCKVQQVASRKLVDAEVMDFKEQERLVVVLNKSVKLNMVWNGKLYEGRMASMDFTSPGPTITKTITGVRG